MDWPVANLAALGALAHQSFQDKVAEAVAKWTPSGQIVPSQTRLFALPPNPKPDRWKVEWRWKHPKEGRTGGWHPIWEVGSQGYRTRKEAVNTVNRHRRGAFARERDHRIVGFSTVKHLEFHYEGGGDIDAF